MDSYDLFRQLTKGAHFSKKSLKKNVLNLKLEPDLEIKLEEENTSDTEKILSNNEEEPIELLKGTTFCAKIKKKSSLTIKEKQRNKEEERINNLRKTNKISVMGKNIPPPITMFEELQTLYNVSPKLVNNLANCKYPTPTPIQMQSIPIMLKGRPLMACAPTGSGKTIAFLTPIINDLKAPKKDGFRALILAPTRELSQQIYHECLRLSEGTSLKIHVINKVNQAEQKFGPNSSKKYDILISTPNRVRYLLQQEPPVLDLRNVEWFIIDEADKMLEEGQNSFKEQFDDILAACTSKTKKLALFSATYTVPVSKWALKNLKGLARVTIGHQNAATELVNQELLFVGSESGKLIAIRDLVHEGLKPPVLIFVQSKDRAKQLFEELLYDGINVDVIHADRTQQQRDNVVRAFREGHIWVLICTELMGRGIDFKGVNLVINYDFPPTKISYIHRIGRTGRAGRPGRAITFFTQNDTTNLRSIAQIIKNSGGTVPEYMLKLKKTKKSEKKKLASSAPHRDVIRTDPEFEERRKKKLSRVGQFVKIRPSSDDESSSKKDAQDRAKQLFEELLYDGINVDVIHADRTQQQRDNVVRAFREGHIWVLICTELMGRGIDFKGVNLVINYDFPPTKISYIHRIGRTGRAGRPGRAITFFTQNDTTNLRSIAQIIKNSGGTVPEYMLKLKKTKKSEKKKLASSAPHRDVIRTDPEFEERRKKKLSRVGQFVKIRPSSDDESSSKKVAHKNKSKIIKNILNKDVLSIKPKANKKNKNKTKK